MYHVLSDLCIRAGVEQPGLLPLMQAVHGHEPMNIVLMTNSGCCWKHLATWQATNKQHSMMHVLMEAGSERPIDQWTSCEEQGRGKRQLHELTQPHSRLSRTSDSRSRRTRTEPPPTKAADEASPMFIDLSTSGKELVAAGAYRQGLLRRALKEMHGHLRGPSSSSCRSCRNTLRCWVWSCVHRHAICGCLT